MRQTVNEIDEIFNNHNYDTSNIISKMLERFKLKSAFSKYGVKKEQGYSIIDIIFILLFLPLMGARSIHDFYQKRFESLKTMEKDVFYRFLNNPNIDWRRILLFIAKQFDHSTGVRKSELDPRSALIIDDTCFIKTGSHIEKISYVYDHVLRKSFLGFKNLVLAHFDGTSYKVLDHSLHCEKMPNKKQLKKQYQSDIDKSCPTYKRLKECDKSKLEVTIEMLKRAAKNGFKFKYVIMDSWFSSLKVLKTVRELEQKSVHAVCAVKKDPRKYTYFGESLNAKELLNRLKQEEGKGKRNRKNNVTYYEAIVYYEGIGNVRLFFAKGTHQRHWKLFLSTDTTLNFNKFVKIYSIRWGIEVIFKECKTYLKIGKCQARAFSSQIASLTLCYALYNILVYQKRAGEYTTVGRLFEYLADELQEKSVAEKLWDLFKDLLEIILENFSIEYGMLINYKDLIKSNVFSYVEEKFKNSFISPLIESA